MNGPSPARDLAAQILSHAKIKLGSRIPPQRFHLAIASIGLGLDHQASEVTLALSDEDYDDDRLPYGVMFTDRRILARAGEMLAIDIPYPAIQDVRARTGVLVDTLEMTVNGRVVAIEGLPAFAPTVTFLQAMARVHPHYRVAPPRPLCAPSPADPTGGGAARHDIWSQDVRVLPLLGMAIEGHARGAISPEIGADLVARAMLLDRTLAYGRGSREGWWTSPLGAPDLAYAFSRMLGPPVRAFSEGRARVFELSLESRGNVGAAAASTAVGLVALGLFGVGWVSTPGRSVGSVTVKISPGNAATGFALYDGAGNSLSKEWAKLARGLFEILPRIEARLLLQRAAFGWDMPPEQLDEIPIAALARRVAETIGPLDLALYFPQSPAR
jgi:hypothetical protein